ncbi:YdcF family protein [Corynebacterium uberis]|uniref:YdcF family protein n=1 Tax=Corynebacterium uberis TaxID=2883169 RepID=UPI001D0BB107|nr:YdcF family protein [Corynebacterium uberis]UDL73899.1 YdcF family protein [Corynebacterium uberis]UDL75218.1 YdcF family protein [Corynebacterium uberis]UDL77429.1 YdcF family protein [Corynebacterium uberis]UDL79714.1 YdcF family protein [Corynebacterium uberis]UDL81846.1 YdcF family protein [Corynebacterium uberis]
MRPIPALLAAVAFSAAASYPLRVLAAATIPAPARRRNTEPTIAVLGTAQYNGRASRQFAARLRWAAHLHQRSGAAVVTLGSRLPGDQWTEAAVGQRWLARRGVDKRAITALPEGNDTRGSLEALAQAIDGPVAIVTDPNHCARTAALCTQLGLAAALYPTPWCPSTFPRKAWWLTLLHECGGLLVVDVARAVGWPAATRLEAVLRQVAATVRPSRRARIDYLRRQDDQTPPQDQPQ